MSVERHEIGIARPGWRALALGLVLGLAVALLVTADPLLLAGPLDDMVDFPLSRMIPYGPSFALAALMVLGTIAISQRATVFRYRYRVFAGLLILFAAVPGIHYGPLHPSGFALLFVLMLLFPMLLVEHRPLPLDPVVVVLIGVMTIFIFTATVEGRLQSLFLSYTLLTKFVLILLMPILLVERGDLEWALAIFIGLAVASSFVALISLVLNNYTGYELNFADIIEYKNTAFGHLMRTTAFFSTPQGLAHTLMLAISLTLFWPWPLWLRAGIVAILLVGIGTTFSAGALVTSGIILVAAPFLFSPAHSLHIVTAYLAITVAAYISGLINWVLDVVLLPLGAGNGEERFEFAQAGLEALERAPLLGHGVKSIGRVLDTAVHNAYLQMAADIGLIGGAAFALLLIYVMLRALGPALSWDGFHWNKGLFVGAAGICWHLISEPFYDNAPTWLFLGLVLSGTFIYRKSQRQVVYERF